MLDAIDIVVTQNANGNPVYAYMVQGTALYNPEYSLCGRYKVDAFKEYGLFSRQVDALSALNKAYDFDDEV
jgi:hypothetical protein